MEASDARRFQAQAVQARDDLVRAAKGTEADGWLAVNGVPNTQAKLARKAVGSGGYVCGKAELVVAAPADVVYHLLATPERVKEWMPSGHIEKVCDVDGGPLMNGDGFTQLEVDYCTFQFYSPVAMRDWCFLRFACTAPDGSLVLGCDNVRHPQCPERSGYIRGHVYPTGFVLRTVAGPSPTTRMTVVFQFDVKGWLPSVLRTLFQSDYFLAQASSVFLNGIQRAFEEHPSSQAVPGLSVEPSAVTSEDSFFEILRASNAEDSLGWHSVLNKDFEVHAKVADTICITKGILQVPCAPDDVFRLLGDEDAFSLLMPNLKHLSVVERTEGSVSNPVKCLGNLTFDSSFDKVLHVSVGSELGCDIDLCLLQSSLYNSADKTCVVLFRSISHSGVPDSLIHDSPMGRVLPSGLLVTPLPNGGSLVSSAVQADLHHNFPAVFRAMPTTQVCSMLSQEFVAIINQLRHLLSQPHRGGPKSLVLGKRPLEQDDDLAPAKRHHAHAGGDSSPGSPPLLSPQSSPGSAADLGHMSGLAAVASDNLYRRDKGRLIWTEQLHSCFLEAVNKLGVHSARPQQILQLMNVQGLTAEHVKSHLQKYRASLRKPRGKAKSHSGKGKGKGNLPRCGSASSISTLVSNATDGPQRRPSAASIESPPGAHPGVALSQPASASSAVVESAEMIVAKAGEFQQCIAQFCGLMSQFADAQAKRHAKRKGKRQNKGKQGEAEGKPRRAAPVEGEPEAEQQSKAEQPRAVSQAAKPPSRLGFSSGDQLQRLLQHHQQHQQQQQQQLEAAGAFSPFPAGDVSPPCSPPMADSPTTLLGLGHFPDNDGNQSPSPQMLPSSWAQLNHLSSPEADNLSPLAPPLSPGLLGGSPPHSPSLREPSSPPMLSLPARACGGR